MNLPELLKDKALKPKLKTETIAEALLNSSLPISDLLTFAQTAKDPEKATCIEAMEFTSQKNANLITLDGLEFVISSLTAKAPRVKWESAKVIGNIAHLYPNNLDKAIENLLTNAEHTGTVVRWSAAFALGEIIKLKLKKYADLLPSIQNIMEREEKNSIKKIYLTALKKSM